MRRNLVERRLRVANNIRVRRAARAMSEAMNLSEIFTAVRELLEFGEFVYASMQLGRGGDGARSERVLASEKGAPSLRGVQVRGGFICWSWERGDIEAAEIVGSTQFWTLRMPLSTKRAGWGYINLYREFESGAFLLDINYLCSLFQHEMALAVERVFCADERGVGSHLLTLSSTNRG